MGLITTAAKVGVACSVHGRVQRRQQARWAAQDEGPSPSHAPPATALAANAVMLDQLGQLRASGVLTEAEFESNKSQILGS